MSISTSRPGSFAGKNITFHFGGWYRYDLQDESFGETKNTGDLQYAYLSYRGEKSNAFLNFGRVIANQGVASEQVDGMSAGADLKGGFGIAAFGGIPLETSLDTRSMAIPFMEAGSARDATDFTASAFPIFWKRTTARNSERRRAIDLWFRPVDKAEILGTHALQRDHLCHRRRPPST